MSSASRSINPNKLFLVEAALVLAFITAMEITNTPGTVTHAYNSSTEEAKEGDSEIQHHSWLRNEFEAGLGKTLASIFFLKKKRLSLHEGMKTAEQGIMWTKHTSPYYTGQSTL